MGTLIGSLGPYSTPNYNGNVINEVTADNLFSMTTVATVNHTVHGVTGFDLHVIAPESVSSTLFIIGGAAFGIRRFRQKK